MMRTALLSCAVLLSAVVMGAQTAPLTAPLEEKTPPPQSARQALLELFFGTSPDHLERHLPEITKKAFHQLEKTGGQSFLSEISAIGMQAKAAGEAFQTMATGPVLLAAEEPGGGKKFEVIVERDDLMGDDDQIDLSFHLYRNRRLEALPFLPNLTFLMKMEAEVWRLNEARFTASVPLGDPEFLKTLIKQIQEKQRSTNETLVQFSLRAIENAERAYHSAHPQFSCSLSELAGAAKEADAEHAMVPIDEELAGGKKGGYIFALTGCDPSHYKVAAEPAASGSGQRAFCADESGVVKFSKNGKAITCLTSGEPLSDGQREGVTYREED